MTTKSKTLVEKLLAVREAVGGYVQKSGRNTAQGYNYASEAAITEKIYPAFAVEGILFYPEERKVIGVLEYTTSKGGKMLMTTTETKWVATDGEDRIEVMTIGQGADSGDKGAYKGMAGDKKYAILQLLGIATGDDPERAREDETGEAVAAPRATRATSGGAASGTQGGSVKPANPQAEPATQSQKNKMFAMAKEVGIDMSSDDGKMALSAIVLAATGRRSSKQLTQGDMDAVYQALEDNREPVAA